jgi:hypothetical protein
MIIICYLSYMLPMAAQLFNDCMMFIDVCSCLLKGEGPELQNFMDGAPEYISSC